MNSVSYDYKYHCVAYYMLPPPQQYFVSEKAIEMWDEHPVRVTIVNRKWRFGYETQDLAHTFPWGQKKIKRKYSLVRYPNWLNNNDTDDIYDLPLDADPEESWQVFACWTMEDGDFLPFVMDYYEETYWDGICPEGDPHHWYFQHDEE